MKFFLTCLTAVFFLDSSASQDTAHPRIHIHAFTTDYNRSNSFTESAVIFGAQITYIHQEAWIRYANRLKIYVASLKHVPPNDIIAFVDSYDVLMTCSAEELIQKFLSFGSEIVLGAERSCFPSPYQPLVDEIIPSSAGLYRYVNGGGYIGYQRSLLSMLTSVSDEEREAVCRSGDDQAFLLEYFIKHARNTSLVSVDTRATLFQNMYGEGWGTLELHGRRPFNLITQQQTCFLHFSGRSYQTDGGGSLLPVLLSRMAAPDRDRVYPFNSEYSPPGIARPGTEYKNLQCTNPELSVVLPDGFIPLSLTVERYDGTTFTLTPPVLIYDPFRANKINLFCELHQFGSLWTHFVHKMARQAQLRALERSDVPTRLKMICLSAPPPRSTTPRLQRTKEESTGCSTRSSLNASRNRYGINK
jgi:hypothetical protein